MTTAHGSMCWLKRKQSMKRVVCLVFLSIRPWCQNENQGSWVIGSAAQLFCVQRQQYASTAALRLTWVRAPDTCGPWAGRLPSPWARTTMG